MLDSLAVAENEGQFPQKEKMSVAARIGWALLIAATLYVCYFSHLGAIGFVGPDEPRYAWVAREMVESGDWVTPRLYGKPWFEKPPLYYWSAAICFKLFGVSEASARLPSAVSALLATLALAWLAWRIYGAETAGWFLLLLPTTVGMIGFSHAAATDMPFSGMLTIAMVAAAVVLRLTLPRSSDAPLPSAPQPPSTSPFRAPWLAPIAFGVFIGAAVLAKGPAAIVLTGGTVFFWALFTRRWRDAFRLLHPAAIALFCATALPWYILCARRNPEFLRVFLIEHNFQRFLTPEFRHIQPFWYFLPILLIGLLPWVAWLLWYVPHGKSIDREGPRAPVATLLSAWGVFPLLFFSTSQSKLPGYVLPSIPPLGLLIAFAFVVSSREKTLFSRSVIFFTGSLYVASALWVLRDLYSQPPGTTIPWAIFIGTFPLLFYLVPAIICGLAVIGSALLNRNRSGQILAFILFLYLVRIFLDYLPKLNPHLSARAVATEIISADTGQDIYEYHLRRGWLYGLNFYLHRTIRDWTPSVTGSAIVVTSRTNLKELRRYAQIVAIISDLWEQANVVKVRPLGSATSSPKAALAEMERKTVAHLHRVGQDARGSAQRIAQTVLCPAAPRNLSAAIRDTIRQHH